MPESNKSISTDSHVNLKRFNPLALQEIIQLDEGGETGLLQSLINDYKESCLTTFEEIQKAQTSGNFANLELHSHSLKSSSQLLGLEIVGELCRQIEEAARNGTADPERQGLLWQELGVAREELIHFKF